MNELVYKSEKGNLITNSELVAGKFEKRHADVLRAIDNLECSNEFRACNFAFVENQLIGACKERSCIMTRDGFSFLAMGFTGKLAAKFKEDFIKAFNQMEQSLKTQLPQNYIEALKALIISEESKQLAEAKVKELAPKAEVFDQIIDSTGLKTIGEVAKTLGTGEKRLFAWLREQHILMTDFYNKNIPYQKYIEQGYFEVKTGVIESINKNYAKTYVTSKGELWLAKVWKRCHEYNILNYLQNC
jgi:anti-repressor protein